MGTPFGGQYSYPPQASFIGVPIGNFVGCFMVTIVVTGIFRLLEYYKPPNKERMLAESIFLLPVLGYLLVGINFLFSAISYHMVLLAAVGSAI